MYCTRKQIADSLEFASIRSFGNARAEEGVGRERMEAGADNSCSSSSRILHELSSLDSD
jgi:hypothetical protein